MTRGFLLSVQYIFRNLNKISAQVIHAFERPFDADDKFGKTLEEKKDCKQVLHSMRLSEERFVSNPSAISRPRVRAGKKSSKKPQDRIQKNNENWMHYWTPCPLCPAGTSCVPSSAVSDVTVSPDADVSGGSAGRHQRTGERSNTSCRSVAVSVAIVCCRAMVRARSFSESLLLRLSAIPRPRPVGFFVDDVIF